MARIPADLKNVLDAHPQARARWESLTPIAQRDFVSWIVSARKRETRARRVESIPSRLASGKRRPCCFAIVPPSLYKALDEVPRAKKTWKTLSPSERRDISDWVSGAAGTEARAARINKACMALSAGARAVKTV